MENQIIQKYLDNQIIKIENEVEFQSITKSVTEVKGLLSGNKSSLINGLLIVLDANIKGDKLLDSINEIILTNWKLFRNKNKNEKATAIIRATILEALDQVVNESSDNLASVWLAAKNIYKHSILGKDQKILKPWLEDLGNKYLVASFEEWGIPTLQKGIIRVDKISKQIEKGITDGFSTMDQSTFTANPTEWKKGFLISLTNTLSSVLSKQFGVKELSDALNALNQRNQLIWLKESQFSFSLNSKYCDIDPAIRPLALAIDVSNLTTRFIPPSLDSYVDSILNKMEDLKDEKIQLKEFFEQVSKEIRFKPLINYDASIQSRCSLIQYLTLLLSDKTLIKSAEKLIGLKPTLQLSYSQLTVWLLNDILSIKSYE